ncbi:MAG: VCBS repeat-containing protein [Cyclobacteriaceae bacterium]
MKQIFILILSFLSLTIYSQVVNENFDTTNGGWTESSDSGTPYFEWGDPMGTQINDDNGIGGNAWVTGLGGGFTMGNFEVIFLTSQAYDLSSLSTNGSVSFAINYDLATFNDGFEDINDGAVLEYTTDGFSWNILGSTSSGGTNWYNDTMSDGWIGNSGGWVTASHDLPGETLGQASVQFRFVFFSGSPGGAYGHEGLAIDDFQISGDGSGGGDPGGGGDPVSTTEILTIMLDGELFPASITNHTDSISLFIAPGTDVSVLAPNFTLSDGATVDIASGIARDFSSPVSYTVTSQDGMTNTVWIVSAIVPDLDISLSPASGIAGTQITILGKGFGTTTAENTVTIGGIQASVTSANSNKLTVNVPSSLGVGLKEVSVSANGLNSKSGTYFSVLYDGTDGNFSDYKGADFNLGNAANYMELADLDKDGDVDLVFDNGSSLGIATIENGLIQSTTSASRSGGSIENLAIADLNDDGYPDVVAGGSQLGWFKNNGDGTWAAETVIDASGFGYKIRVFDADCDFDMDIIADGGGGASLFKNSGSGSFTNVADNVSSKLGIPYDWDEDGDMDMVTFGSDGSSFLMLKNDGSGTSFTDSTLLSSSLTNIDYVQIGDLDHDGDQDIVYTTYDNFASSSAIGYILNNGDSFGSETSIATEGDFRTENMKLGDLNGDGYLDIARIKGDGSFGTLQAYNGSASLSFGLPLNLESSMESYALQLVDINQDGDLDIIAEASTTGGWFPLSIKELSANNITGFSLAEETGASIVDEVNFRVTIEVNASADITSLTPTISLPPGATIFPESGVARDFSSDASYTVTAEDGLTQNWTVSVSQLPGVPVLAISNDNVGQTTADISWNQPTATSAYEFELSLLEDFSTLLTSYNPLAINLGTTTSASLTELSHGTQYYGRILAKNSEGKKSNYSNTITFITTPASPALTDVPLANIGQDSILVNWEAVSGIVDNYDVEVSLSQTFTTLLDGYPTSTSSTQFTLGSESETTPLTPNTTYWVRISAINTTGTSGFSNTISVLTKPETPILNEVANENISQTEATVSWNSVFTSGGSYSIEVSNTDFDMGTTLLSGYPQNVSVTNLAIGSSGTALEPATTYWVRLKSENTSGGSSYSNVITFTTRPADPVLTDIALSDIGQNTANLSWNAVLGSESYDVEVSLSQTFTTLLTGYPANTTSAQLELGNIIGTSALASNTTYWVRILANNATGASGYSNAISILTKPETPVINAIANSDIGQTNANVSWNSVFSSGGSYNLEVSTTDFASGGTLINGYPLSVSSTSIDIGIDAGTNPLQTAADYWIRIRANNTSGESPNSSVISFLTKPATPTVLPATDVSTFSFTANWDGVSGVDKYVLEVSTENDDTKVFIDSTLLTSSQVTGLSEGIAYYYTVFTYNSSGNTPKSSRINVSTNKSPTGLSLDNKSVSENQTTGTLVGTLSTEDSDDTSHIYELVSGSGDTDNDVFAINGDQLVTNQTFNAEDKNEYFVRVQTTHPKSASWSESFKIDIADANDAPTDISLDTRNYNPTGYDDKGTVVAELLVTDEDEDKVTFKLLEGHESFQVENTSANDANALLLTNKVFTNEVDSVLAITLEADDGKGGIFSKSFDATIKAFVDTEKPVFDDVVNPTNFLIGGEFDSLALKAIVSDFRMGEVKLFTKLLTEVEFTPHVLTGTLLDGKYHYLDSIGEENLGVAGMEYYFEATDDAGNISIKGPNTVAVAFPQNGDNVPKVESVKKFGRTVSSYQIISIPFDFKTDLDKTVARIFKAYSEDLINREYKIIKWNPDKGDIGELEPLQKESTIELGEGYFFISAKERSIQVENANINLQDPFPLVLKQGWNLIGNPYNLDIDWASVVDKNNANGIVGSLRVLDPENPETWPESNILRELEGAFVESKEDFTLNISYTDASISFGGGRKAGRVKLPEAEWLLPITLSQDEDFRTGAIGMDKGAKITLDKYDQLALPRWFEYLEISFMHHEEKFKRYNRDVVPQAVSKEWEFEVASSKNGSSTLYWNTSSTNAGTLKLLNVQTGEILDMTQQSEYHFNLNGTTSFRLLYSEYRDVQFDFDQISVLDAYPNPTTTSFTIPLRLPVKDQHQVQVSLLDLSGRKVWTSHEQLIDGGAQDMIISRPTGVAPGVYLYQVMVDNDHSTETFTRRITIQ